MSALPCKCNVLGCKLEAVLEETSLGTMKFSWCEPHATFHQAKADLSRATEREVSRREQAGEGVWRG